QPTQPTQSTQPALDLSIVYQSFDQAIEHVRHIILVTTETPLLPIPFGKPTSEDSLKGDRFIKGALEFAEDGEYQTAIELLRKSFAFSTAGYAHLPSLYEKQGLSQHAALSALYLAKWQ